MRIFAKLRNFDTKRMDLGTRALCSRSACELIEQSTLCIHVFRSTMCFSYNQGRKSRSWLSFWRLRIRLWYPKACGLRHFSAVQVCPPASWRRIDENLCCPVVEPAFSHISTLLLMGAGSVQMVLYSLSSSKLYWEMIGWSGTCRHNEHAQKLYLPVTIPQVLTQRNG